MLFLWRTNVRLLFLRQQGEVSEAIALLVSKASKFDETRLSIQGLVFKHVATGEPKPRHCLLSSNFEKANVSKIILLLSQTENFYLVAPCLVFPSPYKFH